MPSIQNEKSPDAADGKDGPGFGVIKIIIGVVLLLIVGSGLLMKLVGGKDAGRGNSLPGERCGATSECRHGAICYAYKDIKRCMAVCGKHTECEPGYTCISAAERVGKRSTRMRNVCVKSSKL